VAGLGVTVAATLLLLRYAVVVDHLGLRILFVIAACGGVLMTAMKSVGLWLRFANRNANPS
jgi:hypothetical protein